MNQKHMVWLSLQMQRGLNTAQGGKGESEEERCGFIKQAISSFCWRFRHCPMAPYPLSSACTPPLGQGETWVFAACAQLRGSWTHPASLRLPARMPGSSCWKPFLRRQCLAAHPRLLRWGDPEGEGRAREGTGPSAGTLGFIGTRLQSQNIVSHDHATFQTILCLHHLFKSHALLTFIINIILFFFKYIS